MRKFHHLGLVATEPKDGEMWFDQLKVWGTDPSQDANLIEWVRFTDESPLAGTALTKMPHVSYMVDDLAAALAGKTDIVVAPIEACPGITIAYFMEDGALIEYMEVKG
jgi:hypothetical protein